MSQSWPPFEVLSSRQKLDALRLLVEVPVDDRGRTLPSEVIGWLSRLLIVRSVGHLEQVVRGTARAFIQNKSGGPVQLFGLSWMEKSRNPTQPALEELLNRFDPRWTDELGEFLAADDEALKRNLASAVDKRNRIAHGENEGATREVALALCDGILSISDWWVEKFRS